MFPMALSAILDRMNKRPKKTCPRLNNMRTGLRKSDSLAFIIHQLRTPITSTRWFLELLESPSVGKLNAEQRTHLRDLKEINSYMRELVDTLLDITSIDWLEEFLLKNARTFLFVTHDRAFARRLSNRVAELDRGKLYAFDCVYDAFVRRREELLAAIEAAKPPVPPRLLRPP